MANRPISIGDVHMTVTNAASNSEIVAVKIVDESSNITIHQHNFIVVNPNPSIATQESILQSSSPPTITSGTMDRAITGNETMLWDLLQNLSMKIESNKLATMLVLFKLTANLQEPQTVANPMELFNAMINAGKLSQHNVIFLQVLLWKTDMKDLFREVTEEVQRLETAHSTRIMHLHAPSLVPYNGYRYIHFHCMVDVMELDEGALRHFHTRLASLLGVPEDFVVLTGVQPTGSVWLTFLVPDNAVDALEQEIRLRPEVAGYLANLKVDHVSFTLDNPLSLQARTIQKAGSLEETTAEAAWAHDEAAESPLQTVLCRRALHGPGSFSAGMWHLQETAERQRAIGQDSLAQTIITDDLFQSPENVDVELPFISKGRTGSLLNSRNCQFFSLPNPPVVTSKIWKEPRHWKSWTLVRTGIDLYRALQVPYQFAFKVLSGWADAPEIPLVEARELLRRENCRGLLLWAGRETEERILVTPPQNMSSIGMTHFVQSLVKGEQLLIFMVLSTEDINALEDVDSILRKVYAHDSDSDTEDEDGEGSRGGPLLMSGEMDDQVLKTLKKLGKKLQQRNGSWRNVDVNFVSYSQPPGGQVFSLAEALKMISQFHSQRATEARQIPENSLAADLAEAARAKERHEKLKHKLAQPAEPTMFTRCHLRRLSGTAAVSKLQMGASEKDLCLFDDLFDSLNQAKSLLSSNPKSQLRHYQRFLMDEQRKKLKVNEEEFQNFTNKVLSLEHTGQAEIERIITEHKNRDFFFEMTLFLQDLEFHLPPGPDLNILLLGRAGHGKSATGNSILNQDAFVSSSSTSAVSTKCAMRLVKADGRVLKIVDTPGIMDPAKPEEAMREICNAIAFSPEGFHAAILVWKYGNRMYPDEVKTIRLLEHAFDKTLLSQHALFLLTHGDIFEEDKQMGKCQSFDVWVKQQGGDMAQIVRDCKERIILFDNRTTDRRKKKQQLLNLVDMIDAMLLKNDNSLIHGSLFKLARENLKKEILANKEEEKARAKMEEELRKKIKNILGMVKRLKPQEQKKLEEAIVSLQSIKLSLEDSMASRDNCLKKAMDELQALQQEVEDLSIRIEKGAASPTVPKTPAVRGSPRPPESPKHSKSRKGPSSREHPVLPDRRPSITLSIVMNDVRSVQSESEPLIWANERRASSVGAATASGSRACFPSSASIRLQDGRRIRMSSLQEGDVVLCGKEDGTVTYSTVYMFGHREESSPLLCVALTTGSTTLKLSHDHLVFRRRLGRGDAVPAQDVQPGDEVAVYHQGCTVMQWEPVTGTESRWETGVVAPFTLEGTVVVDDMLASCYVAVTSHALCHTLLWPIRKLAVLAPSLSRRLHRSGEGGIPGWVELCLHHLVPWLPGRRLAVKE